MAVFILQTYNASSDQVTSSCIKTGERHIVRLDELNRLQCSASSDAATDDRKQFHCYKIVFNNKTRPLLACVAGSRRGRGIGEIRRVLERKGSA